MRRISCQGKKRGKLGGYRVAQVRGGDGLEPKLARSTLQLFPSFPVIFAQNARRAAFSWLPSCLCLSFGSFQSWSSVKNYCAVSLLEVIPGGRSEAQGEWDKVERTISTGCIVGLITALSSWGSSPLGTSKKPSKLAWELQLLTIGDWGNLLPYWLKAVLGDINCLHFWAVLSVLLWLQGKPEAAKWGGIVSTWAGILATGVGLRSSQYDYSGWWVKWRGQGTQKPLVHPPIPCWQFNLPTNSGIPHLGNVFSTFTPRKLGSVPDRLPETLVLSSSCCSVSTAPSKKLS